jgi:hypothetical protein
LSANGWTSKSVNGKTLYTKQRTLGSDGSYFVATISNATSTPIVYSQAYVSAPLGRGTIRRAIRVSTVMKSQTTMGILARNQINLGSDFLIDSYDSRLGSYASQPHRANADIGSISTNAGQLMIADSKIFGKMHTPPTGSYSLGKAGMVGDQTFQANPANAGTVESGWYLNDLNQTMDDVQTPPGSTFWAAPTWYNKTTYTYNGITYTNLNGWSYVLTEGNYNMGNTTLKGNLLILGNVNLYIPTTGRIQFGSGDVMSIPVSAGSSMTIYNASTTDAVMKDTSNDSLIPSRFVYYGLPTTAGTKLTLTGSGAYAYAGVIYAPSQNMVLTGSSGGNQDFLGSVAVNNFTMSGHTYMHFDEALNGGASGNPVINSYAEIASYAEY